MLVEEPWKESARFPRPAQRDLAPEHRVRKYRLLPFPAHTFTLPIDHEDLLAPRKEEIVGKELTSKFRCQDATRSW